ncbi:MAG: hypothetical protein GY748_13245 [Planctomycetaceae bacterium]|nr:hypothetical protein [Planctomycetaceae bacterium]
MHRSAWDRKLKLSFKWLGWFQTNTAPAKQALGEHVGYLGANVGALIESRLFLTNKINVQ